MSQNMPRQIRPSSAGVLVAIITAMAVMWVGMGYHFAGDANGRLAYGTHSMALVVEE